MAAGKIPVLFDVVERGEKAPEENKLKPPPPPEKTEFRLDDPNADSEDPTVVPGGTPLSSDPDKTEPADFKFTLNTEDSSGGSSRKVSPGPVGEDFNLDGPPDDTTVEQPVLTPEMIAGEDFPPEDTTLEHPILTPEMLAEDDRNKEDQLVKQAMAELMPELENLAEQTLRKLIKATDKPDATESDE